MFKIYFAIVFVSLFVVFLQHAARVVHFMGFHVTVYNHTPGPCHQVPGLEHGYEDMETLPNGLTFITSGFTWSVSPTEFKKYYDDNNIQGRILLFDFKHPDKGVTVLELDEEFDQENFAPHGLSVIQNEETGLITLFVVNHYPGADKIEKFEFIEERMMLRHVHSYMDMMIHFVNDVAATSENSFYITNYGHNRDHLGHLMEIMLFLPFGNIVYFDGANYEIIADGLVMANGIYVSKDQRYVYQSNGLFTSINIYQREHNDSLTLLQEYPIYMGPDNILVEPKSGNIIVAGHPATYLIAEHLKNPQLEKAPSKVLMIHLTNGSFADGITEIFSNDGQLISGSSVASIYDNKMLIGSVVEKLVYCELRTLDL